MLIPVVTRMIVGDLLTLCKGFDSELQGKMTGFELRFLSSLESHFLYITLALAKYCSILACAITYNIQLTICQHNVKEKNIASNQAKTHFSHIVFPLSYTRVTSEQGTQVQVNPLALI